MAGSLQNSHVVHLVPTLLLGLLASSSLALPLRALAGLRCYYAGEAGDTAAAGRGAKRVKPRRAAGGKKEAAEDDIDLGGAESLVVAHLGVRTVSQLAYHGAFENLIIASLFALASTGMGQATERLLGWRATALPPAFAAGALIVALVMLAKVDLLSATTSPTNKALTAIWGVIGFAAALALHVLQPGGGVLAWDMQRAAAAVGPTLTDIVKAAGSKALQEGLAGIPHLALPASSLQVALALVAAALSVLLYAPALRFMNSFWLQLNAPDWAADYIAPWPAATLGLLLHMLLPLLTTLLWMRPMCQELFQLSDPQLVAVQAAALLVTAAVMAANQRTLLQRYLDRALAGWHQLKHGSLAARAKKDDKRSLGELIRARCKATNFLLGKAAVQLLAPAAMYLGMGLVMLHSALHPAVAASAAADTQALVQTCVGFLAAWAGANWFLYCAVCLWMYRTGMLQA